MASIRRPKNNFSVVLSDVAALTSALPAVGVVVTNSNLADGAVVLTDIGLRRTTYAALAAGASYFIVQGRGSSKELMKSSELVKGKDVITSKAFLSSREQISVFGWNGTTGNMPSANNTNYYIKVRPNNNDEGNRSQPDSYFATYTTDASATAEEVAFGLVANGNLNNGQPVEKMFKYEATSNGTAAVVTDGTQTQDAAVVNGSRQITLYDTGTTTAGNTAGIAASIPVGSWVNIAGATYRVIALNANVVTLNVAYQGATGTVTGGTTIATQFAELTTITAWGVRITGLPNKFDVVAYRNYFKNRFTPSFSDTSTLYTLVQGAREGNGTWQQVAWDEYFHYGYQGQNEMIATPPRPRDMEVKIPGTGTNTELTSKYSVINIGYADLSTNGILNVVPSKGNVLIYLNLLDNAGLGELATATDNTGETLAAALGITPSTLNEV